ncbi:hypothetical protein K439DRAFT_1621604 [Ramaria rubella]|nr:hypothetical protein K439DRAFT_1621604 [Ramaria rubella]
MGQATSDPRANASVRQPQGNLGAAPASHAGGRPHTCVPLGISPPSVWHAVRHGGELNRGCRTEVSACHPRLGGAHLSTQLARRLQGDLRRLSMPVCSGGVPGEGFRHASVVAARPHTSTPVWGGAWGVGAGELRKGSGMSRMRTFGQPTGSHNGVASRAGRPAEEGPVGAGGGQYSPSSGGLMCQWRAWTALASTPHAGECAVGERASRRVGVH